MAAEVVVVVEDQHLGAGLAAPDAVRGRQSTESGADHGHVDGAGDREVVHAVAQAVADGVGREKIARTTATQTGGAGWVGGQCWLRRRSLPGAGQARKRAAENHGAGDAIDEFAACNAITQTIPRR